MPTNVLDFYILDFLGVALFAVSGVLAAGRKFLDVFGAVVIAIVTAIGGGTLRDLLLDRHPVFWIANPIYLYIIGIASVFIMIYTRHGQPPFKVLLIADAFGLAFFTIAGAQIAEQNGCSGIVVVMMGVITSTVGGMIRDVLLVEIPIILRRTKIYATAAIAGAVLYLLMQYLGGSPFAAALLGMSATLALRLAAIVWGITLPTYRLLTGEMESDH